jgi:MtN3 and saliva related transmembrane protein
MSDLHIEIIGLIAATFTTIAFVPQFLKIWKKRDASGVSISMYVIMLIGICIWFCYGVLIESIAVITANVVSGILQMFIIAFALIHRNKN